MTATRGQIRKQFTQLLAEAKAQGFQYEDALPREMLDHFQEMEQLKEAREFIKELGERENSLKSENEELLAKLKAKEAELEEQPEEYKAAKVDLQQAENRITYYKQIAEDAEKQADRAQRKLNEAFAKQTLADEAARKITKLQAALREQESTILKLREDHRVTIDSYEQMHERDTLALQEAEEKLTAALSRAKQIEHESEEFTKTFTVLVDTLEAENADTALAYNDRATELCRTDDQRIAAAHEIIPLVQCLSRITVVLKNYQHVFKTLSDPKSTAIGSMPLAIDRATDEATAALVIYQSMYACHEKEGMVADDIRKQLNAMALAMGQIFTSFDTMKDDVVSFLSRLRHEPNLWSVMKSKFGVAGRFQRWSLD